MHDIALNDATIIIEKVEIIYCKFQEKWNKKHKKKNVKKSFFSLTDKNIQ